LIEADEREKRKKDGYYDGRFRTKVAKSKKKYKRKKRFASGKSDMDE
jgi:hypothetical protein